MNERPPELAAAAADRLDQALDDQEWAELEHVHGPHLAAAVAAEQQLREALATARRPPLAAPVRAVLLTRARTIGRPQAKPQAPPQPGTHRWPVLLGSLAAAALLATLAPLVWWTGWQQSVPPATGFEGPMSTVAVNPTAPDRHLDLGVIAPPRRIGLTATTPPTTTPPASRPRFELAISKPETNPTEPQAGSQTALDAPPAAGPARAGPPAWGPARSPPPPAADTDTLTRLQREADAFLAASQPQPPPEPSHRVVAEALEAELHARASARAEPLILGLAFERSDPLVPTLVVAVGNQGQDPVALAGLPLALETVPPDGETAPTWHLPITVPQDQILAPGAIASWTVALAPADLPPAAETLVRLRIGDLATAPATLPTEADFDRE